MVKNKLMFATTDLQLIELVFLHLDISDIYIYGNVFLEYMLQNNFDLEEYSHHNDSIKNMRLYNRIHNTYNNRVFYEKDRYDNMDKDLSNHITFYSECSNGYGIFKLYEIENRETNYFSKIRDVIIFMRKVRDTYINYASKHIEGVSNTPQDNTLLCMQVVITENDNGIYTASIHIGLSDFSDKYNIIRNNLSLSSELNIIHNVNYQEQQIFLSRFAYEFENDMSLLRNLSFENILNKNKFLNNYKSLNDLYININNISYLENRVAFSNINNVLSNGSNDYLIDNFLIITHLLTCLSDSKDGSIDNTNIIRYNDLLPKNIVFNPILKPIFL